MAKARDETDVAEGTERVAALFGLSVKSPHFITAVTHPSYSHESVGAPDNQRLEFLGDAILDFVVSEQLYQAHPQADEGKLTKLRSLLVNTGALCSFARHHQLGIALRFGKGAAQSSLRESENVLADAVEALIAAAYLDGGIFLAQDACRKVLDFGLNQTSMNTDQDTKSELQERVQALGLKAPTYRLLYTQGPAHECEFEVEVSVNGEGLARGKGRSKRLAERQAAAQALREGAFESLVLQARPDGEDEL